MVALHQYSLFILKEQSSEKPWKDTKSGDYPCPEAAEQVPWSAPERETCPNRGRGPASSSDWPRSDKWEES